MAMFLAVSVLTGGCASSPKQYAIRGEADPILNRDINGKSLSVVVRVYQLSDAQEFSKLTFDTLASGRPESDFLGNALLDKTDAVIIPGGRYEDSQKLLDETKFVGIVAFFRKPDPYYWRQLADAETIRSHGLSFRVQDCYVALNDGDAIQLPGQPSSYRPDCGSSTQSMLLNARPARGNTTIGIDDALPAAKRLLLPR
jgi:type VI secretion system protein VasD